jgi:hypothetical protein
MTPNDAEKEYFINVKKIVEGREKTSIVDVRDVNWDLIGDTWKNDANWEPISPIDIQKLERWIKKSSSPIKESPLKASPTTEESWKKVVEEQKKTEERFRESQKNTQNITNSKSLPKSKKGGRVNPKLLLIYSILSALGAIILGLLYLKLLPIKLDLGKTWSEPIKTTVDSTILKGFKEPSPLKNPEPEKEKEAVIDSNKAYFMKYIIEESIWRAKVKASLYNRAEGKTLISGLKDYTNINETAIMVVSTVNKMFEKFGRESNTNINDLKNELELYEKALSLKEEQAKKILCYLTDSERVSLGTYPSKRVAEVANKEKWISPLGSLHEATTGKSHRGKYPTNPNDPRSVGEPVKWVKKRTTEEIEEIE